MRAELQVEQSERVLREVRIKVNQGLQKFAEESQGKVVLVDLATRLPLKSLSAEDRKKYWDDGVHFTPAGYDFVAEIIFDSLRPHL